jgi:hypothetical protein
LLLYFDMVNFLSMSFFSVRGIIGKKLLAS